MQKNKNQIKNIFVISKKFFNNNNQISIAGSGHNNLRVISTPEFPVPYYQRIMKHPPSPEQVTMDFRKFSMGLDENIIITTMEKLSKTSEGIKALEFVTNSTKLNSYYTKISSIEVQAEIYTNDLVNYVDAAHEENVKIISEIDLADIFKH